MTRGLLQESAVMCLSLGLIETVPLSVKGILSYFKVHQSMWHQAPSWYYMEVGLFSTPIQP